MPQQPNAAFMYLFSSSRHISILQDAPEGSLVQIDKCVGESAYRDTTKATELVAKPKAPP